MQKNKKKLWKCQHFRMNPPPIVKIHNLFFRMHPSLCNLPPISALCAQTRQLKLCSGPCGQRWKNIIKNDRCVNCWQAAERIVHMMFECPLMQGVLQKISSMISREEDTNVDLTCDVVLFHVKPKEILNEKQKE